MNTIENNTTDKRRDTEDYKVVTKKKYDIIIAICSLIASIVFWLYVIGSTGTSV